jgi:DNA-directed RNA polymerase specialized sigma24 family protein
MEDTPRVYLNERILNDIVGRFHADVELVVLRLIPIGAGAQDVIWKTWEIAARKLVALETLSDQAGEPSLIQDDARLRAWLIGAATNVARNSVRGSKRQALRFKSSVDVSNLTGEPPDAEEEEQFQLQWHLVARAIPRLPASLRVIAEDSLVFALKPREIAAKRGLKPAAARSQLARARRRLRQLVAELQGEGGA